MPVRQILTAILLAVTLSGFSQKTTRKKLVYEKPIPVQIADADTITPKTTDFSLSGYEKSQMSVVESFFITNNSGREIKQFTVMIEYQTLDGRQLHSRIETVKCNLPPGETREVNLKAWDRQHLWHYKRTLGRHNEYSTPFDVRMKITKAIAPK